MKRSTMTSRTRTLLTATLVCAASAALRSQAAVVYTQDFSSDPGIKSTTNFNTNRAGTGVGTDLNQNNWIYRSGNGLVTYDAADDNLDLSVTQNVYGLIDLSSLAADPSELNVYRLSFEVTDFSGPDLDLLVYPGTGLDYTGNGTGDGHLFYRMGNTPINHIAGQQGATYSLGFDGTEPLKVTGNGTFTSEPFLVPAVESAGDFLFF